MGGYDTATRVENVWPAAGKYGNPRYWLRYFAPSPAADNLENAAVTECTAIWNSGGHYLSPVSEPSQSRLSGSSSYGHADAQAFVSAMSTAYYDVVPLLVPSNNTLYTWIGQEYGTSMSLGYWNGWASYIGGNNFGGLGTYPLFPALYCSPLSPYPNCTTIGNSSADYCWAVWTPEYQRCGSLKSVPAWDAVTCSPYSSSPTLLWQFAEQTACGLSVDVDIDNSSINFPPYCFNVSYKP